MMWEGRKPRRRDEAFETKPREGKIMRKEYGIP